jgi:hypothetical protein
MASGIILPSAIDYGFAVSSALIVASQATKIIDGVAISSTGPWSPPQWSKPALTIVRVPVSVDPNNYIAGAPIAVYNDYVFDAVIRASHRRTVHKTQHPVLTGASISDHAYNDPARLTLEIGMSDAMAAYPSNGAWAGAATKSISAWAVMKQLQINHTLLTIQTRLDTYVNMLIEDCAAADDSKTLRGLRATITFGETLTAGVISISPASARPQTSSSNPGGLVQGLAPNQVLASQHTDSTITNVPGAGTISSNTVPANAP